MDIQGHRGCRGQMPENTIIGFLSALDRGVNTLELDVVITGDHQVLVSHEAWFSHKYCLDPQGNEIPQSEERKHNIFQMPYAKTREYDCGSKYDAEFPDQEKSVQHKPLLSDVIRAVDAHLSTTERNLPKFNIELKREPNAKGLFQPALPEFVRLVMLALKTNQAAKRTTLQAFGIDTLQEIHATAPAMRTSLLIGSSEDYLKKLSQLGFYPQVISPSSELVNKDMMDFANDRNLSILPWTVNEPKEVLRLLHLGVSGIISDFPDRVIAITKGDYTLI